MRSESLLTHLRNCVSLCFDTDNVAAAEEDPDERICQRRDDNPEPAQKAAAKHGPGIANEHSPRQFASHPVICQQAAERITKRVHAVVGGDNFDW